MPSAAAYGRGFPLTRANAVAAALVLLAAGSAGVMLWSKRPQLSEAQVRDVVHSTIQREAPASFLVTGYVDVTTVTRVENTRTLLPGIADIGLGTTSATVRVPGRVSYGFDVRALRPDMIHLLDDGVIEVELPDPAVYSVEPNLEQMEIETQRGWARLSTSTTTEVRDRAIVLIQQTMRSQGERHLEGSQQPRLNTGSALYEMLVPVLAAIGIEDPDIRFRIGRTIVIEPGRR